jgi:hypothetical protein
MENNDGSTNFGDVGGDIIGGRIDGNSNIFGKSIHVYINLPSREIEPEVHKLVNLVSQGNYEKAAETLAKVMQDKNIQSAIRGKIQQMKVTPNTTIDIPHKNKETIKIKEEIPSALIPNEDRNVSANLDMSRLPPGRGMQWSSPTNRDDWNFGPDVDVELFLLKVFANLERHYKRQLAVLSTKIDGQQKPSERDMRELQDLFSKLQELYSTMSRTLKKQADTVMTISRNI